MRPKPMTKSKLLLLCLLLGAAALSTTGCEDGPFEEAGEEIDDTVDDAEDAFD